MQDTEEVAEEMKRLYSGDKLDSQARDLSHSERVKKQDKLAQSLHQIV